MAGEKSTGSIARWADLALLAIALPIFLLAGWPMIGYAAAAAAWIAQRVIMHLAERETASSLAAGNRNRALGFTAGSTLGRAWLVSASILLVGVLADREDGLAAAILCAALVTVHLGAQAVLRIGGSQ